MEGGGPGPGAAQPQYEEQLLHTQVKSSSLVCLTLKWISLESCPTTFILMYSVSSPILKI